MTKNPNLISGTIFMVFSGLIYTIERLNSYLYWFAAKTTPNTGSFPSQPEMPGLIANPFMILFLLIGIILLIIGFKESFNQAIGKR
jgi:hypothetical protein